MFSGSCIVHFNSLCVCVHTDDLALNTVLWTVLMNDKITCVCMWTNKHKHQVTHKYLWNPSAPGKKSLLSKKVNAQQTTFSLAPSLSPLGLVKPSQIKSAFHQGFVIVVFVRGTVVLRPFRACLSTRQDLCCCLVLVIRRRCVFYCGGQTGSKCVPDIMEVFRSPDYSCVDDL